MAFFHTIGWTNETNHLFLLCRQLLGIIAFKVYLEEESFTITKENHIVKVHTLEFLDHFFGLSLREGLTDF